MELSSFNVFLKYLFPVILLTISYLFRNVSFKNSSIDYLIILLLSFFFSLRYGFGRDYFSYRIIYENILFEQYSRFPLEPVFEYFVYVMSYLNVPFPVFLFLCNFFFLFVFVKYFVSVIDKRFRFIAYFLIFILSYSFYNSLTLIRQYLAVSFFIIGVCSEKKTVKIFAFILGCLTHTTVILPFLIYILKIKINIKMVLFFFVFVFSFLFAIDEIISGASLLFSSFTNFPVSIKYLIANDRLSLLHIFYYAFVSFQICLFVFINYKYKIFDSKNNVIYNLSFFYLFFNFMTITGINSFSRLMPYFVLFYIYILVCFYIFSKNKVFRYLIASLFMVFVLFEFKMYYGSEYFSKYNSQMKFIVNKNSADFKYDSSRYYIEEQVLYYNYNVEKED